MISLAFAFFAFASSLGWAMPEKYCAAPSYIIGGKDTDIKEVPYMASLFYDVSFVCGASIVSDKYLLTAAHCIYWNNLQTFYVRVGSSYREKGGVVYKIKRVVANSNFSLKTADYDAGILEVEGSIQFNENTKPIRIVDEEPKSGELSKISGFGLADDGMLPEQLKSVEIPIYDRFECDLRMPLHSITPRMICSFIDGECKSAFKGDSGGPVVVNGKLAGAVSWGNKSYPTQLPNVHCNFADPDIRAFIRRETGI